MWTRTAPGEEEGAARPSGFDPRGGRAGTEGYEVIAEALVRAADGFGVAIGRAAVLGAAEHDCGMITALSVRAAAPFRFAPRQRRLPRPPSPHRPPPTPGR